MAKKYSHPDGGYGFDGAGFAMDKASQLSNFLGQHLKNQANQHFATGEQRAAAKKQQELDRSGMNGNTLRGIQAGTEALTMMGAKPEFVEFVERGRRARYDERMKRTQGDILERAGITPSEPSGFTPMVTPAERARESEAQRMAQQYGGNEMGLAIRKKAPGETPEDLVAYYQAQRGAGEDPTLKQKMVQHFATQPGFTDHQLGGEKAASMFVDQNPDIAFREFNKNVPLEVIGDESNAQIRVKGNEGAVQGEAAGIDMNVDMNKAAVQQEVNQKVAFEPLNQAVAAQFAKTDTGTGVSGMQPGSVAVPAEFQGQLKSNLDWKANKEVANLGLTLGTFDTSDPAFDFVRKAVESMKGNKGFSYDQ
mgnify:FL=1